MKKINEDYERGFFSAYRIHSEKLGFSVLVRWWKLMTICFEPENDHEISVVWPGRKTVSKDEMNKRRSSVWILFCASNSFRRIGLFHSRSMLKKEYRFPREEDQCETELVWVEQGFVWSWSDEVKIIIFVVEPNRTIIVCAEIIDGRKMLICLRDKTQWEMLKNCFEEEDK